MGVEFTRIKSVGISSSGFLLYPKECLQVVAAINKRGSHPPVFVELYPFKDNPRFHELAHKQLARKVGQDIRFDPAVTLDKLGAWKCEFGEKAPLGRFHLPFAYDKMELWLQALMPTPTTIKSRGANNAAHLFFAWFFGECGSPDLKRLIQADTSICKEVVMHANNAIRAVKDNSLKDMVGDTKILVANAPAGFLYPFIGDSPRVSDPTNIAENLVAKNPDKFEGTIVEREHLDDAGTKLEDVLKNGAVLEFNRGFHIPSPGQRNMSLSQFKETIASIREARFKHPQTVTLDDDFRENAKKTYEQKVDDYGILVEEILN